MDPSIPELVKLLSKEHAFVEIEARLRGEIVNNISIIRLLKYPCDWEETKYFERRRISKIDRKCTYRHREVYSPDKEEIIICKSSLARDELYNMWCTIYVSTEINAPTMLDSLENVEKKDITRIRATIKGHWIDITYDSSDDTYDNARVEIEVPESLYFEPQNFLFAISFVCSILQDSMPVMVERLDWTTINCLVKQPLGAFCVSTKSYQKPITMVKDDVMKVLSSKKWLATPKADGVRRMVYIMEGIVLSVDMVGFVRHVCTSFSSNPKISILDCEYLENENIYYVIDIPVHNDNYVGNTPTYKRLEIANDILSSLAAQLSPSASVDSPEAKIVLKSYKSFSSFKELENLYHSWLKKYCIDGIIFANKDEGYFQRVLKWKDTNTIDLEVALGTYGIILNTCDGYTLDIRDIILTNENILTFGIWEFKHSLKDCVSVLEPVRHRPDKPRANSLNIVQKNTRSSFLPNNLFTGIECFLMRKYHNRTKARLLSDSHLDNAVIMDIGTGQGGDLNKWFTAKKVYCLEPDIHAIAELRNRISQAFRSPSAPKVHIIQGSLRNFTQEIPKISIITAFFCMNLWQAEDWEKLEQIIKNKGSNKCRFLAIALTHPVYEKNRCWTLIKTSNTTYTLSIHNTRITEINESIVNIKKLNAVMQRCGLHKIRQERLSNRTEMTNLENILSNMYTAFVYIKGHKS